MSAPCHKDTCSIEWSTGEEPGEGRVYIADVRTFGDGVGNVAEDSLACQDGELGLGVRIDPAAGNLLTSNGAGLRVALQSPEITTWSNPPNQTVLPSSSTANETEGLAPDGTIGAFYWTNSTGVNALAIVSGEFNFNFRVLGDGNNFSYGTDQGNRAGGVTADTSDGTPDVTGLIPYNANVHYRLLAKVIPGSIPDTLGPAVLSQDAEIGGMIYVSNNDYETKTDRRGFTYTVEVPAGQHLSLQGDMCYVGPAQTLNVIAPQTQGFSLYNLRLAAIPLA